MTTATINEVAEALRTTRYTIMRLIRDGELEAQKTGESKTAPLAISVASIHAYIARHTEGKICD